MLWSEHGTEFCSMRYVYYGLLVCRLDCRRVIHDCRPDEMVSLEGDGNKNQLKSESMGVLLAKGVPRLP